MKNRLGSNFLLLVFATILTNGLAQAQRTGTRIGHDATQVDAPAVISRLADCIADRRPALVRKWFSTLPGTSEEHSVASAETADMSLCLDDSQIVMDGKVIAFSASKMRYPVAIAALRKMLPKSPAQLPIAKNASPWFATAYAAMADKTKLNSNALGLQDFGHCVATTDWPHTRAFLMSSTGSPEQGAALNALVPVLGPCLPAEATIKLNPDNLRKVLAEPVYHILSAPPRAPVAIAK